ncbi:NAD(P)-binding protein [Peniophora sp. CONT]|nr:NAD(P)-binding protein [Peniophora sp. CONT]
MTTIPDDQLYKNAARAKGRVVVITGGANGIGKETALTFAKHGAKVVIGDLDVSGGEAVVAEIKRKGGNAAFTRCDVLNWDNQVALFDLALSSFGSVDIVCAIAGLTETGNAAQGSLTFENGKPQPPQLKTLQVNLVGVFYTCHLAVYHLQQNRTANDCKSLILMGSMSSWQSIPGGPQYSASKHAVLGLMRSLHMTLEPERIRTAVVHPWFADTAIVPTVVKVALAGIPLTPVSRIAGAVFYAALDADASSDGAPWLLPDDGPVFLLPQEKLTTGVYGLINTRAERAKGVVQSAKLTVAFFRDIARIIGPLRLLIIVAAAASVAYSRI